eukprot:751527-Hanusia_phi.AAC.1
MRFPPACHDALSSPLLTSGGTRSEQVEEQCWEKDCHGEEEEEEVGKQAKGLRGSCSKLATIDMGHNSLRAEGS